MPVNVYEELCAEVEKIPAGELRERLPELFQRQDLIPYLFEVLNFLTRSEMGVPMQQADRDDSGVPDDRRDEVRAAFVETCKTVGNQFVSCGDPAAAWPYFRAGGLLDEAKKAVEDWTPDPELLNQGDTQILQKTIELCFDQGLHPSRGYELILEHRGTCDAISIFEKQFAHGKSIREDCARQLIRQLHKEVVSGLQRIIAVHEGQPAETESILELLADRDFLFKRGYHIDDSHLQSVLRVASTIDASEEIELAIEMCEYGTHLEEADQKVETPPFLDFYRDYRLFFEALMGRNVDAAVDHFRTRAEEAGAGQDGSHFSAQILVYLLERVGRSKEAVDAHRSLLKDLKRPTTAAPPLIRLCESCGDSGALREQAEAKQDILQLVAARIIEAG